MRGCAHPEESTIGLAKGERAVYSDEGLTFPKPTLDSQPLQEIGRCCPADTRSNDGDIIYGPNFSIGGAICQS